MKTKEKIWTEGYDAYGTLRDNPYDKGSDEAQYWEDGNMQAAIEAEDEGDADE